MWDSGCASSSGLNTKLDWKKGPSGDGADCSSSTLISGDCQCQTCSDGRKGLISPSGEGLSHPWSRKLSRTYRAMGGSVALAETSFSQTPPAAVAARKRSFVGAPGGAMLPIQRSAIQRPGKPSAPSLIFVHVQVGELVGPLRVRR